MAKEPTKKYRLRQGKHWVTDRGVTVCYKPGDEVALTENQFKNFRDKFVDPAEGGNIPELQRPSGRPLTTGAKDEGVQRVPPVTSMPPQVPPLPEGEEKPAEDDDDDDL